MLSDELARLHAVVAPAPSSADEVVSERDALLRALAALTPVEREALLLVAWDRLSPGRRPAW